MRKILIILLAFLSAACGQEEPVMPEIKETVIDVTLPDGLKKEWKTGDKISVISLKSGSVATVDSFTAEANGSTSSFSGIYTGSADATLAVVYPALESNGGQIYESVPLYGNDGGFFRVVKGTGYILFAPTTGMTFLQQHNNDATGMESLSFLIGDSSAAIIQGGGSVSLAEKTSVIRLELDASALGKGEKVQSLSLIMDQGTPFTAYRGSMSLSGARTQWVSNEPQGRFEMSLGEFVPGNIMTVYVPVFPNASDASLAGTADRILNIRVKTDSDISYSAVKVIPASSKDYSLTSGKTVAIKAKLEESSAEDSTEPVIKNVRKIMDKGTTGLYKDGDILYVGAAGVLYSLDISDPRNPKQIGSVTFPGAVRQVTVCNGKAIVSARETGVWIFDVSDPKQMTLISRYDGIELSTGIDMAGDCIFVGERQTGVEFVDARDLSKPQHIRVIKTPESQTVFYQNGYLYSGEWATGQVSIFNAKDLNNIQLVKTINLQGYGDGLWVTGNRLYASTGHHHRNHAQKTQDGDGHGVEIWDVSVPEAPVFISRIEFDIFYRSGADWWLVRPSGDGRTLYCGDVFNGMYVVDIKDERNPKIIHRWEPLGNSPTNKKNAVSSIALADGVVYVSVTGEGLYMMESHRAKPSKRDRGTAPVNLGARYSYNTPSDSRFNAWVPDRRGAVKGAAVYGDALFVACGDAGLYTVKKDSRGNLTTVSRLDIPFAGGVAVRGDKLYVARGYQGLGVYRISTNLTLTQIALLKTELNPTNPTDQFSYWVTVSNDKYVVNGCRRSGYQFLAVGGTDASPTYTFRRQYGLNLNYNRYISENTSSEGLMAYATRSGLVWIDLSNVNSVPSPVVYDHLSNTLAEGATLYKNNQFLLTRDFTLRTIASGGSEHLRISNWNDVFEGIPRWESGNDVLICHFVKRRIVKVNTAKFEESYPVFKETTQGYPEPGLFWNGKCVVPCGYQGLLVEK